jgi:hypothetical protein
MLSIFGSGSFPALLDLRGALPCMTEGQRQSSHQAIARMSNAVEQWRVDGKTGLLIRNGRSSGSACVAYRQEQRQPKERKLEFLVRLFQHNM